MENSAKFLEQKLKFLSLSENTLHKKLNLDDVETLENEWALWNSKLKEIDDLGVKAKEEQIAADKDLEEIEEWCNNIEERIMGFRSCKEKINRRIHDVKEDIRSKAAQQEEDEYQRRKQRQLEELEIQKLQANVSKESSKVNERPKNEIYKVRLPKLVITPFNGTYEDWPRFWSQFEVEIDKNTIPQVTKFSYLKELVEPKVRVLVDGLPFNSEGFERAKNILKEKFGKPSKIINAHVQKILQLPTIHGTNPKRVYDFYEKLAHSVQVLDTMGRLKEINGNVRMTLDKLPQVRPSIVMLDDNWEDWEFGDLVNALKQWTERNPQVEHTHHDEVKPYKRDRLLQTRQGKWNRNSCIYCGEDTHKATNCHVVKDVTKRKRIISEKRLCFNCTAEGHRASDCKSKRSCENCKRRHHTSICEAATRQQRDDQKPPEQVMLSTTENNVIYPVVVVKVDGITCRALLDTGAGSTYISSSLASKLQKKPSYVKHKQIEMMLHTTNKKIETFDVELSNVNNSFSYNTEVNKVDKSVLISLPNPRYQRIIEHYPHLKGVCMDDLDTKPYLPVHVIIGLSGYTKIKTKQPIRIGKSEEPVAEYTKFGWIIMAEGSEKMNLNHMMLTRSAEADYAELCKLDVLGLQEDPYSKNEEVYNDFKEQLGRSEEGWYETNILWKSNATKLSSNKSGSIARLRNLLKRLKKDPTLFAEYDKIIREQLEEGIIERVPEGPPNEKEFYLPHKAVVREDAETTKVRIVFDASAKENDQSLSLNDVIEIGPSLQNNLWKVLLRNRMCPVTLTGDMKKAFFQVRIREEDRDALRFHWLTSIDSDEIEAFRFTRAIFGMGESPFLLNGTILEHLITSRSLYPELTAYIDEIDESLYVDDVVTGDTRVDEVKTLKEVAIKVFKDAKLELHKWHSNVKELEDPAQSQLHADVSYAKQEFGTKNMENKILGVPWDKEKDTFGVNTCIPGQEHSKRGMLKFLASIYDPLGLISPITLLGKDMYRRACDLKLSWDETLPDELKRNWMKWIQSLPTQYTVPRSLTSIQEVIHNVDLHVFADASLTGVSAAVYVVINQGNHTSQGLLTSKSRLSKKNLTVPRLELVAAHMAANLLENTKQALQKYPINECYGWSDSMVVLYWLNDQKDYKQFVFNRIKKINEKSYIKWRHVPGKENPADLGSRGCHGDKISDTWINGPTWLKHPELWPNNPILESSDESEKERKIVKEIFKTAIPQDCVRNQLLNKYTLRKTLRILAWVKRFITNTKLKMLEKRENGPLTTEELDLQMTEMIKLHQTLAETDPKFKELKENLNLQKNRYNVYECHGRIEGDYPIFIPRQTLLAEKLIERAHYQTLHGGVGLTMAKIRSMYWIPRLRQVTKGVIHRCHGCKRFHAIAYQSPIPGKLPPDRVNGYRPFQVVGLDFAGPIYYKSKKKTIKPAYILLITCSLSRAVHLELLGSQKLEEFTTCFKRFVARRGRPQKVYSDNAKTFKAASKWMKNIIRSEQVRGYFTDNKISWQFNLSRAPWWGGQFERMVGLMKQCLYKSTSKANLTWSELEDVLLDIESTLNNRPLSYVEDDIQLPIITPNTLAHGEESRILEENFKVFDGDLRKRAKYIKKCKEHAWNRWRNEYLKSLRERHNMKAKKESQPLLSVGDVVIIKGEQRNRNLWRLGIVEELIQGKDGIVRAAKVKCDKVQLQRAVQHLYPMELQCDNVSIEIPVPTEIPVQDQPVRQSKRTAAAIARLNIQDQAEDDLLLQDDV